MNVILIVIDTLRQDHLGVYGYKRNTSPNIDRLSEEGTSLNSYTVLPRSEPTIASMLTGMYPHSHNVRMVWNNKIKASLSTLAEILKSHGYKTVCIRSGHPLQDGSERGFDYNYPLLWKIKNKIKRGFYKALHHDNFLGMAEQAFTTGINWIKKNKNKKFFLMLHSNDLHWPYPIPNPYENMFDQDYKGEHDFATLCKGDVTRGELIFGVKKLPQEEINHAIAHYDGGIRYTDVHVGRLLEFLKEQNLYDNTLIIFTSDHGEHFGEHDFYFQHGASLYEPSLKVPLIFRFPEKIPRSRRIRSKVQSLDIMPTVLDILGIPLVDDVEGISLLPLMQEKTEKGRDFIFAESIEEHFKENKRIYISGIKGKWRTMIINNWKIIYIPHPEKDIFELYNLEDDPEEKDNLIEIEKEKAKEMKERILNYLKIQNNEGDVNIEDLTEKSKKFLIKAGYLDT